MEKPMETSPAVKHKVQELVNEIVRRHGPHAYLNGMPVHFSDNVPTRRSMVC